MNTRQHAERVDRAANDPRRIEKRKDIAPAFTVARTRIEWTGNIQVHHEVKA